MDQKDLLIVPLKPTSISKPATHSTPRRGRPPHTYASSIITPKESVSQKKSICEIGGLQMPQASFITGTRSISMFLGEVCAIAGLAGDIVTEYTLFENPLPNSQATLILLNNVWNEAQFRLNIFASRSKQAESWVSPCPY